MTLVAAISRIVGTVLGNVYPAYATYNALMNPEERKQRYLLMFWTVNTCFTFLELFGDVLLAWLPLYYEAKIVFIVFLTIPNFKGSKIAYKWLQPYLHLCEPHFDALAERVSATAARSSTHMRHQSAQFIADRAKDITALTANALSAVASASASAARSRKNSEIPPPSAIAGSTPAAVPQSGPPDAKSE